LAGSAEREISSRPSLSGKGPSDGSRRIGDLRQWLGISGEVLGTSGTTRRTLFYGYAAAAMASGAVTALRVITIQHVEPQYGLAPPIIMEGSSWLTVTLFLWIPWIAGRIAPLGALPRWRLLLHAPAALLFSLGHVVGFVVLRKLAYWIGGAHYDFGSFVAQFPYEFGKDVIGYALLVGIFALTDRSFRPRSQIATPEGVSIFDIRDGAKLTRVRLDQVLAISSAGNYVEFLLSDGRRLLMRSPLSAIEQELGPRGFLRTHRSWLVNPAQVTALKPVGSGDYTVELGKLTVPLSRRFPLALAKLRGR
jgi:hypothetical protein